MNPAETVAAAFSAVRAKDLDAAIALFSEDCVISLPGETYEGRQGVRTWQAERENGRGPRVSAGEPEAVDERHVLVPLVVDVAFGEQTEKVKVTGVWTVVDGLVTKVRAVAGGRRMAIASLAKAEPEED